MALKIGVYNPSSSKKANVVDETMSSSEVVESGLGRGFPNSRLNTFPQRSTSLLSSSSTQAKQHWDSISAPIFASRLSVRLAVWRTWKAVGLDEATQNHSSSRPSRHDHLPLSNVPDTRCSMERSTGSSHEQVSGNGKKRAPANGPDGQPTPKRSRVSRACDQCRASREKCDGQQPECQTCSLQQRPCTYHEQPKKRGIQPNFIRTLESSLAWLFQNYEGSEASLAAVLASADSAEQRALAGIDQAGAEKLHEAWRDAFVCKQIDQMLSGQTVDQPSPALLAQRPKASLLVAGHGPSRPGASIEPSLDIAPAQQRESTLYQDDKPASRIKLPVHAWTLFEFFFAFTGAWLPIVDKQKMLQLMYGYPTDGLTASGLAPQPLYAELWALLALAATHTDDTEALPTFDVCGKMLSAEGCSDEPSYSTARLLLALMDLAQGRYSAAWHRVGTVLRTSLANDIDSPPDAEAPKAASILAAALILEIYTASRLGVVPHASIELFGQMDKVPTDGYEEWTPWVDPSGNSTATPTPTCAWTTFRALSDMARSVLQQHGGGYASKHTGRSAPTALQDELDVVRQLLDNCRRTRNRRHPKEIVEAAKRQRGNSRMPAIGRQGSFEDYTGDSLPTQPVLSGAPFEQTIDICMSDVSQLPSSSFAPQDMSSMLSGTDIFEELAMLENMNVSQNPQFMQNLGFGPDLDLAEFFGADYQPSDPLLAYMQPGVFDASTNGQGPSFEASK